LSLQLVVVSEARADFNTAAELADRVLVAQIGWLEEDMLESQRQWVGEDSPGRQLAWTAVAHRARALGIRVQGHFDGEPGLADARAGRRAILYVLKRFDVVDAILLIRDSDDQHERRRGLDQARAEDASGKTIIIGVANCERESWVISGFVPETAAEEQALGSETQKLGCNPCLASHDLTAVKNDRALRSPKRVLRALAGDDWGRQQRCWRVTSLAVLEARGQANGLAAYLKEIRNYLAPLITGYEGRREQP
jgi:hypothetical protein